MITKQELYIIRGRLLMMFKIISLGMAFHQYNSGRICGSNDSQKRQNI